MVCPSEAARTLRPVAPQERPFRTRRTARVLLISERDELLLFSDHDPAFPERSWWITPGGGVEDGESWHEAALREVEEETGYRLSPGELLGPLARQQVDHGYSDVAISQTDVFFVARVRQQPLDTSGHTEQERRTMTGYAWMGVEQLGECEIWPDCLPELLTEALALTPGQQVDMRDLDPTEDSTVPMALGHRGSA